MSSWIILCVVFMPHLLKIKVLAIRRSALDILTTIYLVRRGDLLNFNIFNIKEDGR